MIVAALLLLAATGPSPAGMYQTHQMEVAAALELKPNHRFRYALAYGAVDEEGEGDWTFDGKTVRLTSNPMPKAPRFELVRDDPAPKGELYLNLEDPGFDWGQPLRVLATNELKGAFEIEAEDSGRVDLSSKPAIVSVAPEMPVFGPTGDGFRLSRDHGHKLLLRFHRNDLGRAPFDHEPLDRDGTDLLLQRYDTSFRFQRVRS